MPLSIRLIFLIAAAICFTLGAIGAAPPPNLNWTNLGLLFLTIAFMV